MAIITLDEYKLNSGINSPNKDAVLQPLIDMANTFIPRYCNSNFEPFILQQAKPASVLDNIILLDTAPVISVEQILLINDLANPAALVQLLPGSFYLDKIEGIVTVMDPTVVLPETRFGYSIDYTTGWNGPPADIVAAAQELVRYYEKREFSKSKDLGNGQAITHQSTNVIPIQIRAILDTYRVL
jgi:hypothetical protein